MYRILKTFPVVFTYFMRLTGNRHLTLFLDVFQMVWCEAGVRHDGGTSARVDHAASPEPRAHPCRQWQVSPLTMEERQAIEATLLNGLSSEFATQCGQPIGTIKSWIRSGWATLQYALHARGEEI